MPVWAFLFIAGQEDRAGCVGDDVSADAAEKKILEGLAAAAALYHDAPEILTGDLPTPIKYYNPDIRDAYREVEQFSANKLLHMLPEALRPSFDPLLREGYDPGLRTLVKAADKLSAHIKCVEELKAGNAEFKQAAEQTLEALRGYGLPELDYFLEHFLPAFGLTLDELQ